MGDFRGRLRWILVGWLGWFLSCHFGKSISFVVSVTGQPDRLSQSTAGASRMVSIESIRWFLATQVRFYPTSVPSPTFR